MKTAIRKCRQAARRDPGEAQRLFVVAQRAIDKAARKGVIHPNQAARRKSRLAAYLHRLAQGQRPTDAGPAAGGVST